MRTCIHAKHLHSTVVHAVHMYISTLIRHYSLMLMHLPMFTLLYVQSFHTSSFPPALQQVDVVVTAITATSISLSWSVASGLVAMSEVVWRETDRGTESSSGSLTGTSYTIDQLESATNYTVTVQASNVAGIVTESKPLNISTGMM